MSRLVWSGRTPADEPVKGLVTIVDKTEHARRRRTWEKAFTTVALKGYEDLVKDRAVQLVNALASLNLKETQDLADWFASFAYVLLIPQLSLGLQY